MQHILAESSVHRRQTANQGWTIIHYKLKQRNTKSFESVSPEDQKYKNIINLQSKPNAVTKFKTAACVKGIFDIFHHL